MNDPGDSSQEKLVRVFNTAIVSTHRASKKNRSSELFDLVGTPAFQAILHAVERLSTDEGITEQAAAERIIETFRKVDQIWGNYLFHEGLDYVFKPKS